MKRLLIPLLLLLFTVSVRAQCTRYNGRSESPGQVVTTAGTSSSTKHVRSFPAASVQIYLPGTITPVSLFSDSSCVTPKANPFTSNTDSSYFFYASGVSAVDIRYSGGGISVPFTVPSVTVIAAGTAAATTTTLGTVKMSVAPVSSASPIAVGDNDPRINYRGTFAKGSLPATCTAGQTAKVTDDIRGFWYCVTGDVWTPFTGEVNIKDFGAKGDGSTNDSAAISSAMDVVRVNGAGGGTVFIPPGKYRINSAITQNFTSAGVSMKIRGVGNASQFYITVGIGVVGMTFSNNAESLYMEDLTFVGNPAVTNDALQVVSFNTDQLVTLNRVNFYGLASLSAGGAIVNANGSSIVVRDSEFAGCATSSGVSASVLSVNGNWKSAIISGSEFVDFGLLNGVFHSKTSLGSPLGWIGVTAPTGTRGNMLGQVSIVVENCKFDEGGLRALDAQANIGGGDQSINSVIFRNNAVNVGNIGNSGVFCNGVDNCIIEDSLFGYSTAGGNMVYYQDSTNVVIRRSWATSAAGNIRNETESNRTSNLTLEDTIFTTYQSGGGNCINYKATGLELRTYCVGAASSTAKATIDAALTNSITTASFKSALFATTTNCSDSAGDATCGAAPAGTVVIDAADTTTVVSTTAVTANSEITLQEDSSLGARLGITCNTTTGRTYTVTARTAGTSFTITASGAPAATPACLSYKIIN